MITRKIRRRKNIGVRIERNGREVGIRKLIKKDKVRQKEIRKGKNR